MKHAVCWNCWDELIDHSNIVGHCVARRTMKPKQIPNGPLEYRFVECKCKKFELAWIQHIDDLFYDKKLQ